MFKYTILLTVVTMLYITYFPFKKIYECENIFDLILHQ